MGSTSPEGALPLPPSTTLDLSIPDPLWRWNVVCQTLCLSITGIVVILRTYVRFWVKRVWILEDYLCCFSFLGLVIYSSILTTVIAKRGGTYEWDITTTQAMSIFYYLNICQIWYGPAAACIKSTILVLYLRVFSPHRRDRFSIVIWMLIAICCAFYLASSIAKIWQCIPRVRIWDKSVPGHCLNLSVVLKSSGIFNLVSDTCILMVPLKDVWKLQMSRTRKLWIYGIFTVGAIAPVFSIVGLVKRLEISTNVDQSYSQPIISLWAEAELATGVMIICLPTLPRIFKPRMRRPSTSIVNGSARSRSKNAYFQHGSKSLDINQSMVDGEYLELVDGRSAIVQKGLNAVVNDIRGGEVGAVENTIGFDGQLHVIPNRILKTVRIEQSNI